ncbi:MAG: hypothetical protein NTU44_03990, partial [Bacteroidetes bacterium]|nr:hypothetical protein [Bacteroidota bacterium]
MKRIFIVVWFFWVASAAYSQTTMNSFHENFEQPGGSDSMVSSQKLIPGIDDWHLNTRLHNGGLTCDSCQVKAALTLTLTTLSFSTAGYDSVVFRFDHICKVDVSDLATIEYSLTNGLIWTSLTSAEYLGSGTFNGVFGSGMYGNLWQPATNNALPCN